MSARTARAGCTGLRRRVAGGALITLAASLGSFMPATAAAHAAAQAPATVPAQTAQAPATVPAQTAQAPATVPAQATPAAVTAGTVHSCAIESGKAYCWGDNSVGELGNGTTVNSSVPVAVSTRGVLAGQTLTQITASGGHVCALDSAGAAFCWGSNDVGQLGNNSTADSSVPVAVLASGALAGQALTQITSGNLDTCALDSAGAAFCWGWNDDGELGDGNTSDSSVPVAVQASGVLAGKVLTEITSGLRHTCAVDTAGTAFCWGNNDSGQLGNASTTSSSVPVAVLASGVLAGKTLLQISAGEVHTCALDSAGAAFCWGDNADGGLGNGTTTGSSGPVAVSTSGALAGQSLTQISAGESYTCAVDAAGAAFCWGVNTSGVLGNGGIANTSVAAAVNTHGVLAGKALVQITAGGDHTCAVDNAGALYCWGQNTSGDLGNGGSSVSTVPVLTGPHAPTGLAAVPAGTTAVVSWTAPTSLDGGALTGYTATATPGGQACTTVGAATCTITGLTGLPSGTLYEISVVAHTTAGDSGASTPVIAALKPAGAIVAGDDKAKCVDDMGDSAVNLTVIAMGDCNGSPEQDWAIEANGTIQINGKCMDIKRDSKLNGGLVELYACNGGANQQWLPRAGTLVNPVSGKCLNDPAGIVTDGTQLNIWTCSTISSQQWQLP
jgi:alpha-tubulin suppressor-like RCC1 family protein